MPLKLLILLCLSPLFLWGQTVTLQGVTYNEASGIPISNAHIIVKNSHSGTASGIDGTFILQVKKLPVTLYVSCIGYDSTTVTITHLPERPIAIYLKPKTYDLKTVTITTDPVITLFKESNYTILDYDFLEDNLVLLVFRYQLNRSEIILMSPEGDTLVVTPPPSGPPQGFYKDVFSIFHYFTKRDEAFQMVFLPTEKSLVFPYRTSCDTIKRYLGGFRFLLKNRLYFQEESPYGFKTSIGYYSREEGRRYTRVNADVTAMRTFYSDAVNYHTFRPIPDPIDEFERRAVDAEAIAYKHFYKQENCGDLYRTRDSLLLFFDFCRSGMEVMDADGNVVRNVKIDFQESQSEYFLASLTAAVVGSNQWEWNKYLLQDEVSWNIYAVYSRKGFIRLKKIDPVTGTLSSSVDLPMSFPEKIKLYRGEAYFLSKNAGEFNKWRLYKIALR